VTNATLQHADTSFIEASIGNTASGQLPDLLLRDTYTGYAFLDADFNFIIVNKAYAQAHDQPEDFFPGKNHFDLYPSDAQQVFEKTLESRKVSRITAHPVVPSGQTEQNTSFWDWIINPVLNQENEVEALILAETEVTKRVRTEQALFRSSRILAAINHAQDLHNPYAEPEEILDTLLAEVIDLTESEYGFVGEIIDNADGHSYMEIQTILNFSRNDETPALSVSQEPVYLDLTNKDTLIGEMINSGEAVIMNDLANEPRSSGLPEGHPALNAFLAIPFGAGEKLAGAIGVANCADGYDKSLAEFLQPLLKCYAQLIHSNITHGESREAQISLEQSEYMVRDLAIPAVENEHSELIDMINECYDEMDGEVDAETIKQLLEKIYSAVAEHFLHEEQLMWNTTYPEYEAHKRNHEKLLVTLRGNIDRFVEDPGHDVHILQRTLANWFGRHFSTFDLRLNKHLSLRPHN
jgi:hemerythrin-like metal-binding protein